MKQVVSSGRQRQEDEAAGLLQITSPGENETDGLLGQLDDGA
jgi:hypothetical protein